MHSTFEFVVATTAAMELPGGIEKDELGVALSYAIMLGGGAPSAPNGAAKSTPAVQPQPGQSKKAAKKEAKAKAKADKKAAAPAAAPKKAAPAKPAPAPAAEEEDDDDFWGDDEEQTEEEKAQAAKELEEAKAKAMAKLAKKEANQRSLSVHKSNCGDASTTRRQLDGVAVWVFHHSIQSWRPRAPDLLVDLRTGRSVISRSSPGRRTRT